MKVTLGELNTGESAQVAAFLDAGSAYRRKLLAMGLTPGTRFTVRRVAPLGDPIELEVRGFHLVIRRHEAAVVEVAKV